MLTANEAWDIPAIRMRGYVFPSRSKRGAQSMLLLTMREILVDQIPIGLAVRICEETRCHSGCTTLNVAFCLPDLSVRICPYVDGGEAAFDLSALRNVVERRMKMVPAVISDGQDAGSSSGRPPGVAPIVTTGYTGPVEGRTRFWRRYYKCGSSRQGAPPPPGWNDHRSPREYDRNSSPRR